MTEDVDLTARYAFGPLGLHRVEADVQPGNEPSHRPGFRREGFSPELPNIGGVRRDHERRAIITGMTTSPLAPRTSSPSRTRGSRRRQTTENHTRPCRGVRTLRRAGCFNCRNR
ncbi:GNAT family N-acetyltransferase [Actinomadura formosensis]|uniref:GNAT family N-acetyltransferase n=1 Tax=Actinomadura formosensis TaxID=60706 RepID=UPI003898F875